MIDLLIWSFDRAAQLDALLRSIQRHTPNVFKISVLYNYSNENFGLAYMKLMGDLSICTGETGNFPSINWIKETAFEKNTKYALSKGQGDWVAFSTDDTIFHKNVDCVTLESALPTLPNQVFSFRLGTNTIIQNCHTGQVQPPLNQYVQHNGWMSWDVNRYNPTDNYGYPFGLDLHAFRRELIVPILEQMEFRSTNEIEGQLTTNHRHAVDELRSFNESVAVNIPINSVTGVTRAGEIHGISKEELNKKWLEGWRIDLKDIENTKFYGCHAEKELKFVKFN